MQGTLKAYNTNKIVITYIDITTFANGFCKNHKQRWAICRKQNIFL